MQKCTQNFFWWVLLDQSHFILGNTVKFDTFPWQGEEEFPGLATNFIFFCFLFVKKLLICQEANSTTLYRGNTWSSVPPSNSLVSILAFIIDGRFVLMFNLLVLPFLWRLRCLREVSVCCWSWPVTGRPRRTSLPPPGWRRSARCRRSATWTPAWSTRLGRCRQLSQPQRHLKRNVSIAGHIFQKGQVAANKSAHNILHFLVHVFILFCIIPSILFGV